MATKKFLSLERLTEYDGLIKAEIDSGDATTLSSSKSYTNTEIAKITSGTTVVSKAENADHATTADSATNATSAGHATSADSATSATDASKLGGQLPSYYAKASDIPTGALANKDIISESDLDSALAEKVNAASEGNHSHSNKTVLDGITSAKVSAWDSAEANAKAYADTAATNAATAVKNDLLNGAGTAYDTLKELGDLIDDNKDAIDALEDIASGKANADHDHVIDDVTGLQSALDAKAAQTNLDSHTSNTTVHITSDERTKWNAAKSHADSAHAPSNAQANVIESIKVNGIAQTITSQSVNITVPTDNSQLDNGAGYLVASDIANKANKATTLSGYGITDAYTKTEVDTALSGKSDSDHIHSSASTSAAGFMTAAMVTKLNGIAEGANKTVVDSALNSTSTNPVQNKVVNSAIVTATSAIAANTSSISGHTDRISALETKVGDGFEEITSAEIQALFD